MNLTKVTLGELLSHGDDTIRRNALSALKRLQRTDGRMHIGPSEAHARHCHTLKEYGTCPPWPHG